jgi:tetratricopeptide (TPR) repeat protein
VGACVGESRETGALSSDGMYGLRPVNEFSGTATGGVVQAAVVHGGIHWHQTAAALPTPRQLPAVPPLVERAGELDELARLAAGVEHSGPIVLTGPAGVGKAALGLGLLHSDTVRARYPDGELYGDLRSAGDPVLPQTVLRGFLSALGVPPESVPPDLAGCAALFRSATAARRLAVMLHGATSAAQVRPLIPGGSSCLTIVTSTWRLGALGRDGARWLDVTPLAPQAAVRLLEVVAGRERVAAEIEAAREVVRLCGGLPLAVSMAGNRLASNPHQRLSRLAAELTDERRRLDRLTEDGDGVRAMIDTCYRALPDDAARLYRIMGMLPLAQFTEAIAAAGTGLPAEDVSDLLRTLVEANLVLQAGEDLYRFHELIRLHAREVSRAAARDEERTDAAVRVEQWYLASAIAAATAVRPYRRDRPDTVADTITPPLGFADLHEGLDWLDAQAPQLLSVARNAAEQQRPETALKIAGQMWALFAHRKYYRIWMEFDLLGLQCARRLGDPGAEARMLRRLGLLAMDLGKYDEAVHHLSAAAALYERIPDRHRLATVINSLGVVLLRRGEPQAAVEQLSRALALHEEFGDLRQCGIVRIDLADALIDAGQPNDAGSALELAAEALQGSEDLYTLAHLRMLMGRVRGLLGDDTARAESDLDSALEAMRGLDSVFGQMEALGYRGELAERTGSVDTAADYYKQAASLGVRLGTSAGAWLELRISSLSPLAGRLMAGNPTV